MEPTRRFITTFTIPPQFPILSQMHSVHTLPSYFSKIHLILSSRLRLGLLPTGFPTKILYVFLICPMRVACPSHLGLDLKTQITFGEAYKLLPMQSSPAFCYLLPLMSDYYSQHHVLNHLQAIYCIFLRVTPGFTLI